jgi:hypothetical protein
MMDLHSSYIWRRAKSYVGKKGFLRVCCLHLQGTLVTPYQHRCEKLEHLDRLSDFKTKKLKRGVDGYSKATAFTKMLFSNLHS